MTKNKYWIIGGVVTVLVLTAGGAGFAYLQSHKTKTLSQAQIDDSADQGNTAPVATSNDTTATTAGGLGVASSSASNLGQIGGGTQGSSATGQSSGTTNTGTSNGANASSDAIDPKTFAQYEKYKDSTNALFGDVQVGTGQTLGDNQKAAVVYKGWLTNGQLFDESRAGSDGKVQPFVLTMGAHQVITGWEQGLAGMKVGGTRLLIVPPSVGYGSTAQASIPANSVLVFEVQLLAVQ